MIVFSAITPHPPIIVPGIGQRADLEMVKKTIEAMKRLTTEFKKADCDTVVVISPHAPLDSNTFCINDNKDLNGDFANFGFVKQFAFYTDTDTLESIKRVLIKNRAPFSFQYQDLDHGTLVPLYYLVGKRKPQLISLSFSFLDLKSHYNYGRLLGEVFRSSKKRFAIVASGDLSHRLTLDAPAGYSPLGKKFDQKLISLLEKGDTAGILALDYDFVEVAGECGLRSFVILLGILDGKYDFKRLSYEGPFGVGYLVAQLIGNF